MKDMKRMVAVSVAILVLTGVLFTGCIEEEDEVLNIYHAGSLSVPFDELEQKFEDEHPNVDVRRESAGSVATVKKVTEQGKEPDVVGVADYSLIPNLMYEDHASWTVRFAQNRIVLAYTDQSAHRDEITKDNWFTILQEDNVKFGFSNPNDDPCGYRSQMTTLLAEDHYGDDTIYDSLIEEHTAIEAGGYNISAPEDLEADTQKVMVRSAEVDLMSALETGEIDYLYIYQSVAEQHEGVEYVNLPPQIDLSSVEYAENYEKVKLIRHTGEESIGKPIVYGITIPATVNNEELAVEFVKFLLGEEGREVMNSSGQTTIDPPKVDDISHVPDEIKSVVEE